MIDEASGEYTIVCKRRPEGPVGHPVVNVARAGKLVATMDGFNQWATANPDEAYLVGFSIIVAIYHGVAPCKFGLNIAKSKGIPFKRIGVWGQIKKPHRIGLSLGAVAIFSFFHFGLGAPLLALIAGIVPVAALAATDYRQMERDSDADT